MRIQPANVSARNRRISQTNDPLFAELLDEFTRGHFELGPARIVMTKTSASRIEGESNWGSGVEVRWGKESVVFDICWLSRATPRQLEQLAAEVKNDPIFQEMGRQLIATPYLTEDQLLDLARRGISAIDRCGNGVIVVPEMTFFVCRTGEPNRFPSTEPLKNVFRRASSMAVRTLLLGRRYNSLRFLCADLAGRGGTLTKSTVSRVVAALKEDRIVAISTADAIFVQDAELLLKKLNDNFEPPVARRILRGKLAVEASQVGPTLAKLAASNGVDIVLSGASSAGRYAAMAQGPVTVFNVTSLAAFPAMQRKGNVEAEFAIDDWSPFPNIELREIFDQTAYFDRRNIDNWPVASPIQAYLELMRGDKRDQETAATIAARILAGEV